MSRSSHIMRQRQLAKRLERQAKLATITDKPVVSDADWLAMNFGGPVVKDAPKLSMAELNAREDYAAFKAMCDEEDINIIPDPLGRTGHSEPKSIYSPAPPSKYRVDRSNIRKYKPYVGPIY